MSRLKGMLKNHFLYFSLSVLAMLSKTPSTISGPYSIFTDLATARLYFETLTFK